MTKQKSKIREYIEAIVIALILALTIRAFVVQAFKIPSSSMVPTLLVGDHILVNKFIYGFKFPFTNNKVLIYKQPKRGDIIVFSFPKNKEKEECRSLSKNILSRLGSAIDNGNPMYLFRDECKDFIKRVIAVGGDKVEIRDKRVYVNDLMLTEPYIVHSDDALLSNNVAPRDNYGPIMVPRGKFFVMGDNRDQSYDSRFWGFVDMDDIKGKAFIIYWSWNENGNILNKVRWTRIARLIH
ncbi:MAG: signal peptidase I [Thermodesulfovibrionia bacterium]